MDSILINYPDFRYYSLILEDKAATLDHCMKVRDTSIIREAYEKILSHPQTTESRFKEISERLLNLDKKIK